MKTNAPKKITWWLSLLLGFVGLAGMLLAKYNILTIVFLATNGIWFLAVGWLLLILATALKGL